MPNEYQWILELLCRLPYLRADLIKHALSGIRKIVSAINCQQLQDHFSYVMGQWGTPEMAELISLFGEEYLTTGTCETFHKNLLRMLGAHPQFWHFVGKS